MAEAIHYGELSYNVRGLPFRSPRRTSNTEQGFLGKYLTMAPKTDEGDGTSGSSVTCQEGGAVFLRAFERYCRTEFLPLLLCLLIFLDLVLDRSLDLNLGHLF